MYYGCHLSISEGFLAMAKTAIDLGADTFQFFTRNPRGGAIKEPSSEEIEEFSSLLSEKKFGPIIAHAPYILNPATADEALWQRTVGTMVEDVVFLDKLENVYYNFHPGCHVGQGEAVGIAQTAKAINQILSSSRKTILLIETMAGKGSEIGKTFEEVKAMIDKTVDKSRIGVCLDTCHVNDSGYKISTDPEKVFDEFDRIIGLSYLRAIHLNDSKNPLGAHKDRHEKIGEGYLTKEGIERILHTSCIQNLPVCLETPNDNEGYRAEIRLIRSL